MIGVYAIVHLPTKKAYVGSSDNINKRFSTHKSMLKYNYHHSKYLQNAWNKYGEKEFEFKIISECMSIKDAVEIEQIFLYCFYRKGLFNAKNVAFGVGSGICHPNKSKPLSEEQKLKISLSLKGKKKSPEHIEKVAQGSRGIKRSKETIEKVREATTKYIVYTPDGEFFGLKQAAKFYGVKGDTIKAWCNKKEGWRYEDVRQS